MNCQYQETKGSAMNRAVRFCGLAVLFAASLYVFTHRDRDQAETRLGEPVAIIESSPTPHPARFHVKDGRYFQMAPSRNELRASNPKTRTTVTIRKGTVSLRPNAKQANSHDWSWSATFKGIDGTPQPAGVNARVQSAGKSLRIHNHDASIQQTLILEKGPAGQINTQINIDTDLAVSMHPRELRYAKANGSVKVSYRDFTATDANGQNLPVSLALNENDIRLTADASAAIYPIRIRANAFALPEASYEDEVMELTNVERWDNGQLAPYKRDEKLDLAAERHSHDMCVGDFVDHTSLNDPSKAGELYWYSGEAWNSRIRDYGYTGPKSENIAAGYASPSSVIAGWMDSSGHRSAILSTGTRELGVGYYAGSGFYGRYWTQDFGTISSIYPVVINREAFDVDGLSVSLYIYGDGWAQDMRFSNDNVTWSAWEPYNAAKAWSLSGGIGVKTVYCQLRKDGEIRTESDTIVVTSSPEVDPTISDIPNQSTDEDVPFGPYSFTVSDDNLAACTLNATSSNTTLVPNANIVLEGTGAGRSITITPTANQHGTTTITLTITDGGGASASDTFDLTVNSVNDPPIPVALANGDNPLLLPASGSTVTLSASGTSDPDNGPDPLSYSWAYDAGPEASPGPTLTDESGDWMEAGFVPAQNGTYSYELLVSDGEDNAVKLVDVIVGNIPEIQIEGNGQIIANGDTTPSSDDDTDFGGTPEVSGTIAKTFTIKNLGPGTLDLTGSPLVDLGGGNPADFSVTTEPPTIVPGESSVTFTITFDPRREGTRKADVTIESDDANEGSYTFRIQGEGLEAPVLGDGGGGSDDDGCGVSGLRGLAGLFWNLPTLLTLLWIRSRRRN